MISSNNKVNSQSLLVNIVTVVRNAETTIQDTIESVINQSYKNIEYIIIDGNSSDQTVNIIRKFETHISYWISEPDEGIYHAMNKGIAVSAGDIIGILNAGDVYTEDAVERIIKAYTNQKEISVIVGNCKTFLETNSKWLVSSGRFDKLPYKMLPHPSIFVPRSVYKEIGLFDTSFKISADYDFLCRCYQQSINFVHVDQVISIASPRGVSSNYYLTEIEYLKSRLKNHLPLVSSLIRTFFSLATITGHQLLKKLRLWHFIENQRHKSYR